MDEKEKEMLKAYAIKIDIDQDEIVWAENEDEAVEKLWEAMDWRFNTPADVPDPVRIPWADAYRETEHVPKAVLLENEWFTYCDRCGNEVDPSDNWFADADGDVFCEDCAHMLFEKLPDNAIRSAIEKLDDENGEPV